MLGDQNLLGWSHFAYATPAHLTAVRRMDILFPCWSPSLEARDDSNSSRAFHDSSITWPLGTGKEQNASPRNPQEICDATAGFKKGYERREQTWRLVWTGRYGIWKLICEDLPWSNVCTTELFERLPFLFLSVQPNFTWYTDWTGLIVTFTKVHAPKEYPSFNKNRALSCV